MKTLMATVLVFTIAVAATAWPRAGAEDGRRQRIDQAAAALAPQLVATRRDFHMHPELSNREVRTAGIVAEKLRALGLDEVKTDVAKHGVTALLKGSHPGPVVAVRADMDALPIQETIDVPYKSQNPGVKHACGHDAHTTIELGVAEVLSKMRDQIHGSIKFIFQPAEEGAPAGEEGGAALMIKEGALDNPRPSAIFGLHVMPTIEAGRAGYGAGGVMASADRFTITIHGRKSHGANPQDGIDAIVVASECVTALQTIRSRRIDSLEPFVISIGIIQGGNRFNIIADEVKLEGTIRTLNEEVRQAIPRLMKETVGGVCSAYGAKYDMEFEAATAVTYNDPKLVEESLPSIRQVVGEAGAVPMKPMMISEDFSYYQKVVPGFFFFLGVGNRTRGITALLHTPDFDLDESSLVTGVRVMSNVLLDYLDRHSGTSSAGR